MITLDKGNQIKNTHNMLTYTKNWVISTFGNIWGMGPMFNANPPTMVNVGCVGVFTQKGL